MEPERNQGSRSIDRTVLVVDDSAVVRKMVTAAFLANGFKTCVEAANGKEGIEVARRTKPDVIILDLSMPVMNGLEAAPELRKILPNTPIVLFTLYADSLLDAHAARAGINLVLAKSVPLPMLINEAQELLAH